MGISFQPLFQPGQLAHQALGKYLFDPRFILGNRENSCVSDAIDFYLAKIGALVNPDHPKRAEREWGVKPDATSFEKLKAAFASVMDQNTPTPTASQRGDLVEYYRTLRNEQLKESRLFLWEAVGGKDHIEENQLAESSGNEVAEQFEQWLVDHPDSLQINYLQLSVSGLGITLTHLPPEIQYFTELRNLWIEKTSLKTLPPEIGKLINLEILNITENFLEVLPPEIGNLSKLKKLVLTNNHLVELSPMIGECSRLEILILDSNKLKKLPPEIRKLRVLWFLSLRENCLEKLPVEMGALTHLWYLSLSVNSLKELPLSIGNIKRLATLVIDRNPLRVIPRFLGQLPELIDLSLPKELLANLPGGEAKAQMDTLVELRCFLEMLEKQGLIDQIEKKS